MTKPSGSFVFLFPAMIMAVSLIGTVVRDHVISIVSGMVVGVLLFVYLRRKMNEWKGRELQLQKIAEGESPDWTDSRPQAFYQHLQKIHLKALETVNFIASDKDQDFSFNHIHPDEPVGRALLEYSSRQKKLIWEEEKRRWITDGLARFSEILRTIDQDLPTICDSILKNLVKYLGANQGGFFLEYTEDNQRRLKLMACYAYDRKKHMEVYIAPGQGLIGQVMLEKSTIYLKNLPKDYVKITSGLGEETPNYLIIVPLVVNEAFYGAFEIASFKDFDIHQREFLEQVAKNIASAVATILMNDHTKTLLEESQLMAGELQEKEEEMHQNLEELQATQEEMRRKQAELDAIISAISSSQGIAEFSPSGELTHANEKLLEILHSSLEDLQKNPTPIFPADSTVKNFWNEVLENTYKTLEYQVHSPADFDLWLRTSFLLISNSHGVIDKVILLVTDVTGERVKKEEQLERLSLVADNTDNSVIITDKEGLIEFVNRGFVEMTGYTPEEVMNKKPGSILQGKDTDQATIGRLREALKNGHSIYEEILNYRKSGESYWVSLTINPVRNKQGHIYKYIAIQADITQTKKSALDYKYQLEAIGRSNAICEMDMTGHILDVNDNFLSIIKYSREEIIGKQHRLLVPESYAESKEYQQHWESLQQGQYINDVFQRINREGEQIYLRGVYNPIYDFNGKPERVIKFVTDVTKEKALQSESEKQRKKISAQLETINKTIATLELTMEGVITFVNSVYLDVSGYSFDELIGSTYDQLLSEVERHKPQTAMMWDCLKTGSTFTGEFKQVDKSGNVMWLSGTLNPILNEIGEPEKVIMYAQFTTSSQQKQDELIQMVHAFKECLPVLEFNNEGKFKNANTHATEVLGYSKIELRERYLVDIFDGEDSKWQHKVIKHLQHSDAYRQLVIISKQNKEKHTFRADFSAIRTMDGQLLRIMMVLLKETEINASRQLK